MADQAGSATNERRIEALLESGDVDAAGETLWRCHEAGAAQAAFGELVYRCVLQPEEADYRAAFEQNVALLAEHGVLFTAAPLDFDAVKHATPLIPRGISFPPAEVMEHGTAVLLVDVIDSHRIVEALRACDVLYLLFTLPARLHYLLLYEDLEGLRPFVEAKRLLVFGGVQPFNRIMANITVPLPDSGVDWSVERAARGIVDAVAEDRQRRHLASLAELRAYYRRLDRAYYRELLAGDPAQVTILLVTSAHTHVNHLIAANWHRALRRLGYDAHLLIEQEPYEWSNTAAIVERMQALKPDVVFHINWAVRDVFGDPQDEPIRSNLLWIMRLRDFHTAAGGLSYQNNMFVFSHLLSWVDRMRRAGLPDERVMYLPDGVDVEVFAPRPAPSGDPRYEADVVSVNNTAGGEARIERDILSWLESSGFGAARGALERMFRQIRDAADQGHYMLYEERFERLLQDRLRQAGVKLPPEAITHLTVSLTPLEGAYRRRQTIDWILRSGITRNVKLWGREWGSHAHLRPCHMGVAEHGRELAAIYQHAKISISDVGHWTLHERNAEIIASGGFPLILYGDTVNPETGETIDQITNYLREGEEVVLFRSGDELLEKVAYFLAHDDERRRIAERARGVILERFSTEAVARTAMEHIKAWYRSAERPAIAVRRADQRHEPPASPAPATEPHPPATPPAPATLPFTADELLAIERDAKRIMQRWYRVPQIAGLLTYRGVPLGAAQEYYSATKVLEALIEARLSRKRSAGR